jgi:amino acid transporter
MIYWALLLGSGVMNIWGTRLMALIEDASLIIHIVAFIVVFVVMWVCAPVKHSASFVFTLFQNNSGWSSDGVSWSIGMLSSCYVLAGKQQSLCERHSQADFVTQGYDGAIHLCEEMLNPAVSVPWCMLGSLVINGVMGFAFLLAILFCMGDMATALNSTTGFPIIEIFKSVTGSPAAATAMTCTLIVIASLATIPLMASTARMLWCLARDKGMLGFETIFSALTLTLTLNI